MSRAVMQQALEALEAHADIGIKSDKAITALRAALAEPEQERDPVAYHGWVVREVLFDNGEPLSHRDPVQEPVAWVECDGELVWNNRKAAIGRNLYTAPTPRQWVSLTEQEMYDLFFNDQYGPRLPEYLVNTIKCVEAALKEKNT